jgi:hypothetical protein
MSLLKSERGSWFADPAADWRRSRSSRPERLDTNAKLLIAGVVVVGLGWLTWSYLGPDVKRYLKIHSM